VLLEALPLTPNGKIDRKALPLPEQESLSPGEDFIAPRTPTEAQVAAIWSDLLGVARISVYENFFALGGHSLLAVRVLARMQAHFQIELPLSALFEAPTIAELALRIEQFQARQRDDAERGQRPTGGISLARQAAGPLRAAALQTTQLRFPLPSNRSGSSISSRRAGLAIISPSPCGSAGHSTAPRLSKAFRRLRGVTRPYGPPSALSKGNPGKSSPRPFKRCWRQWITST
jgi:hypothetical protein